MSARFSRRRVLGPSTRTAAGTSTEREWGFMPSKEVSATGVPLTETRTWWSGSAAVSLPPWRWTREPRGARGRRRRRGRRGSRPGLAGEEMPQSQSQRSLASRRRGGRSAFLLEGAGARREVRGSRDGERRSGRGRRRRWPCAGRRRRRRARRRRRWCRRRREPSERKKRVDPGTKRSERGSTWKGTATPWRERRIEAVSSMRAEEARSGSSGGGGGEEVLPGDGVEALGAGDEAGEEALGLGGGWRAEADAAAGGAADAGLAGDDAVEDDGDEQPCGRGRGGRGRRRGAAGASSR